MIKVDKINQSLINVLIVRLNRQKKKKKGWERERAREIVGYSG